MKILMFLTGCPDEADISVIAGRRTFYFNAALSKEETVKVCDFCGFRLPEPRSQADLDALTAYYASQFTMDIKGETRTSVSFRAGGTWEFTAPPR